VDRKTHVALPIALLALILVFVVVCGAHLGGLSHDDAGGVHSIATAILIAVAVVPGPAGRRQLGGRPAASGDG
jgi:magnesium-transporting ATPase (P-type)